MTKYEGQDHYLDPDTGILQNELGINDEDEIRRAEASLVAWRSFELSEPIQGLFDLDHLKAIHEHLFGNLYEWAGEIRDIDLARNDSYFANHK
jgi:fido (protein-threonine AMPylation protein)